MSQPAEPLVLDPAPAADAAAPIPPATPDSAPWAPSAATRQVLPDNDRLSLVDPVVEGARKAVVERHRACSYGNHGQTSGADSAAE